MSQQNNFKIYLPAIQLNAQQQLKQGANQKFGWNYLDASRADAAKIEVVMNKQFLFNQEKELWIHFKNISIPTIMVRQKTSMGLNSKTGKTLEEETFQRASVAQMFAVYEKQDQSSVNFEVLRGKSEIDFQEQVAEFRGLHFSSTSFSQKGHKFLLVIIVQCGNTQQSQQDKLANTHIIMSPPIYVESRKKAHLERQNKESVFDPFLPELLDRVYYTKNDLNVIDEDIEGLYNYCTQQRIRNKTYHPLFLAMKFNKDIKVFYDSSRIQPPDNLLKRDKFMYNFQREILRVNKNTQQQTQNDHLDTMPLIIIYLNFQNQTVQFQQQLMRVLKSIEGPVTKIVKDLKQIPDKYNELIYSNDLKDDYRISYYHLVFLKYQYNSAPELLNFYELASKDVNYYSQQNVPNSQAYFHHAEIILSNISEEQRHKRFKVKVNYQYQQHQSNQTQQQQQPQLQNQYQDQALLNSQQQLLQQKPISQFQQQQQQPELELRESSIPGIEKPVVVGVDINNNNSNKNQNSPCCKQIMENEKEILKSLNNEKLAFEVNNEKLYSNNPYQDLEPKECNYYNNDKSMHKYYYPCDPQLMMMKRGMYNYNYYNQEPEEGETNENDNCIYANKKKTKQINKMNNHNNNMMLQYNNYQGEQNDQYLFQQQLFMQQQQPQPYLRPINGNPPLIGFSPQWINPYMSYPQKNILATQQKELSEEEEQEGLNTQPVEKDLKQSKDYQYQMQQQYSINQNSLQTQMLMQQQQQFPTAVFGQPYVVYYVPQSPYQPQQMQL